MSEMQENDPSSPRELAALTAEIVGAYVGNNTVATSELPPLITAVARELAGLSQAPAEAIEEAPSPAVPIRRSVTPEHIICLEDGKKLKMLKRHLKTRYNMTPDEYRKRWGLKDDYPMVAPSYAAQRSDLAKKIGLGRKPEPEKVAKAPRKRPGRKPAAKKG